MPSPDPNNGVGFRGFANPNTPASDYNAHSFLVWSILARVSTATLVQVTGVTNDGGVSPVGFVNILPLVNQVDGANNAVPHGTIFRCPYTRLQGGGNAVILDPQIGDIGIAVFADRDISSATATKGQANPGSRRRFDMSDGLYIGGALNGVPTQYVQFSESGINITSPSTVSLNAPTVQINCQTLAIKATESVGISTASFTVTAPQSTFEGNTTIVGLTTLDGSIAQTSTSGGGTTATIIGPLTVVDDLTVAGKSFLGHEHGEVQSGDSISGVPV